MEAHRAKANNPNKKRPTIAYMDMIVARQHTFLPLSTAVSVQPWVEAVLLVNLFYFYIVMGSIDSIDIYRHNTFGLVLMVPFLRPPKLEDDVNTPPLLTGPQQCDQQPHYKLHVNLGPAILAVHLYMPIPW
jgi:hypothetical protein